VKERDNDNDTDGAEVTESEDEDTAGCVRAVGLLMERRLRIRIVDECELDGPNIARAKACCPARLLWPLILALD